MATYTHKRCPHCGKLYETYSTHTKNFSNHSGSPFLTCKFCGKTFVDKDIKEPALKPYSDSGFSIFNCIFAFFWPFGVAGIILTGCTISPETSSVGVGIAALIVDAIYLLLTGHSIKNRKQLQKENKQEYEQSLERLKKPQYAMALKKAGFKVPEQFLKENIVISDTNAEEDTYSEIEQPAIHEEQQPPKQVSNNQEKYKKYDIEFIEIIRDGYDLWKNKNPDINHYEFLKYLDTLDSCYKKDGKSALDFCYELYNKDIILDEVILPHTFKQLNDVIDCTNENEIDWLKQKVVNGIDGFYVAWVLEHP